MDYSALEQLGIAVILSSLIGLEREHRYQETGMSDSFGGVRTFIMVGLLGALAYLLNQQIALLFPVVTAGFLLLVIGSYFITAKNYKGKGATSDLAAFLTYFVGVLCGMQSYVLATTLAIAVFLVLHFKTGLHEWAKRLRNEELISTAQFIIVAFVILPLLPDKGYGPYEVFNPYIIWLMVVFISGISFASYIAIKVLGEKRGIGLTGFLAGLISSTALVLSFSPQSKKNKTIVNPYVFAVLVASTAMFFRILLEVSVLNRAILPVVAIPIMSMASVGILASLFFWFKRDPSPLAKDLEKNVLELKSPFSMGPALKFGALFAVILFVSKYMSVVFGDKGLYLTSVVSGLMDVNAITVSVSNLSLHGLSAASSAVAISLAAMTNTLVKGGIFLAFGSRKVALRIAAVFAVIILAGGVSLLFAS